MNADSDTMAEVLQFCNENKRHVLCSINHLSALIVRTTSIATLFKIIEHHGGKKLIIPTRYREHTKLAKILSKEEAEAIIDLRGGEAIDVPTFSRIKTLYQRHHIILLKNDGLTTLQIARKTGLTPRRVRQIVNAWSDGCPSNVVSLHTGAAL